MVCISLTFSVYPCHIRILRQTENQSERSSVAPCWSDADGAFIEMTTLTGKGWMHYMDGDRLTTLYPIEGLTYGMPLAVGCGRSMGVW
jgi:hypothetical protein